MVLAARSPALESLEPRLLLDGVLLAPGAHAMIDFDADGVYDAALRNTGATAIEYDVAGADGLALLLTGDDAAFETNTWVNVGDADPSDDFHLAAAKVGVGLEVNGLAFDAIAGASQVSAGSIGALEVGAGDLAYLATSEGDLGTARLGPGSVQYVISAGAIGALRIDGSLVGMVVAATEIAKIDVAAIDGGMVIAGTTLGRLDAGAITGGAYVTAPSVGAFSADRVDGGATVSVDDGVGTLSVGTLTNATIIVNGDVRRAVFDTIAGGPWGTNLVINGHVGSFRAGTLSGGSAAGDSAIVAVGDGVDTFVATTVTGGTDGMLIVDIMGDVGRIQAALLHGGTATAGGFASAAITVHGNIRQAVVWNLDAGSGDGSVQASLEAVARYGPDGSVVADGDIGYLYARDLSGGNLRPGGTGRLLVHAEGDIGFVAYGRISGAGGANAGDAAVQLVAGGDLRRLFGGGIYGANGTVEVRAVGDIGMLWAGTLYAQSGTVNLLAGVGHDGLAAAGRGSIGYASFCSVDAGVGAVNIMATGDIAALRVLFSLRAVAPGSSVTVSAGGTLGLFVRRVYTWRGTDPETGERTTGVRLTAGRRVWGFGWWFPRDVVTVGVEPDLPSVLPLD